MTKKQKQLVFATTLIIVALILTISLFLIQCNFKKVYIKPNTAWQSKIHNIIVFSDEYGNLTGKFQWYDENLDLKFYRRNNSISIIILEYDEFLLFGKYSVNKTGDIIIENITTQSEFWNSDTEKITLKQVKK